MSQSGIVFNIQRNCIHDGPGIRTDVFLKGCPLRCQWCCNPESQKQTAEIAFISSRCISCGRCVANCPKGAISVSSDGHPIRDSKICINCGKCTSVCPQGAWKPYGKKMSVEEVLAEVLRDEAFYRMSGGGVTFTGGEPTAQGAFLSELLKSARYYGINTALETTCYVNEEYLAGISPMVDLFMIDLKHMDDSEHKRCTGVSNRLIHENAEKLVKSGANVLFRVPLIPGYNDTPDNLQKTGEFVKSLGLNRIVLLPFHQMGSSKYDYLQREYILKDKESADDETVEAAKNILEKYIDKVSVGGGE